MRINEVISNVNFNVTTNPDQISVIILVDGNEAGIFEYDASTGRTVVELDSQYQGKGLGKVLILKGIYTAIMHGLDYIEDETRTQAFDNAIDSLESSGFIVRDDEYLYVTHEGETYLKTI